VVKKKISYENKNPKTRLTLHSLPSMSPIILSIINLKPGSKSSGELPAINSRISPAAPERQ